MTEIQEVMFEKIMAAVSIETCIPDGKRELTCAIHCGHVPERRPTLTGLLTERNMWPRETWLHHPESEHGFALCGLWKPGKIFRVL